jgi:hypothetical protein
MSWGLKGVMIDITSPVAVIAINDAKNSDGADFFEPIYGGYVNARSEVVLFAKDQAYGVNFKNHILRQRPPLNEGAKTRYDAVEAGEEFVYCNKTLRRLSFEQIEEICKESKYRLGPRS